MGGICSRSSAVDNSSGASFDQANGCSANGSSTTPIDANCSKSNTSLSAPLPLENRDKQTREPFVFPDGIPTYMGNDSYGDANNPQLSRELSYRSRSSSMLKPVSVLIGTTKVSEMSSLLGRVRTAGLGKAVEMLDTLGSSVTSLKGSGFSSTIATKGNKITILSFEVANTIVKGANLMQSLSEKNVRHLKEVVFLSQGVQTLISNDIDELLRLAASDKRDELKVFSGEVVRFGNRCKDPQWHNLDRYFVKLEKEIIAQKRLKEEATTMIDELMTSVHYTSELYHESHALDRFEQDYNRKCQEMESPDAGQKSETLAILRAELKSQKKHVRDLEKKSLWSKVLEEVMEKLVDIVHCLYLELNEVFKSSAMDGDKQVNELTNKGKKLGPAGLALHYANIINQIDTLVSRSSSIPPNVRDTLYQGLPPSIKSSLRPKLQSFKIKEELTVPQIKAEMEKTLQWLVPLAANTTKAHHGFGWVGEWANTGSEINRKHSVQNDISRIETLYHADKEKTDFIILDLITWLHHLVNQSKSTTYPGIQSPIKSPNHSPSSKYLSPSIIHTSPTLSPEDEAIFRKVNFRKLVPGISKSQEIVIEENRRSKHKRLIKSTSHSPTSTIKNEFWLMKRASKLPVINFNVDKMKALDVIDRVDTIRS